MPGHLRVVCDQDNGDTLLAIEPLENDTGLPVVTSNQAGLWQALRMAGIDDKLLNLGRLLHDY